MVAIKLELLLFINVFYVTDGVRRITDGKTVDADKSYVVYLVKAINSNKIYDEWLCGGALVSTWFIITAAACVTDVEFMYAIAGYKKYVPDAEIEIDQCTKEKKKKVTYTCVPKKYELDYQKAEKWAIIDIALVKVESPYDLNDTTFKTLCSYIPTVININYEPGFQKPGTDALVYGWGHSELWRKDPPKSTDFTGEILRDGSGCAGCFITVAELISAHGNPMGNPEDNSNYNEPTMRYAATKIIDKPKCKKAYETLANMGELIDHSMICTLNQGEFNDKGEFEMIEPSTKIMGCQYKQLLNNPVPFNDEIVPSSNTSVTNDSLVCEDDDVTYQDTLIDATRRDEDTNQTSSDSLQNENRTVFNSTTRQLSPGICQNRPAGAVRLGRSEEVYIQQSAATCNDHGGPLVTWVGGQEILIGVASVFRVSDEFKCMGPYLYTSTQCNGAFLDCVLTNSELPYLKSRRAICDSPSVERGYDKVERYISWEHHPSGTADNKSNANTKQDKKEGTKRERSIHGNFTTAAATRLVKV